MIMKRIRMIPAILFATALFCSFAADGQTETPQQVLQQYVFELQKSPNDTALREKIIRYVSTMKKAPAIPEEARRYFIQGNALLKAAKDQKGYELAVDSYRQCLLLAPWWSEANYNLAVALELSSQFDDAMNELKLYIAANPGEEETRKAQDKIYELGAKKIIASREREESSPQAVAAREQNKFEDWLRKLDGRRYTSINADTTAIIDVQGHMFVQGWIGDPNYSGTRGYHEFGGEIGRVEIKGRETTVQVYEHPSFLKVWAVSSTFIISEDGNSITVRTRFSDGDTRDYPYHWQR
jgi:tetratricopeptide (TPR) repeat protein